MQFAELIKQHSSANTFSVALAEDDPDDVYLFRRALCAVDSRIHLTVFNDGEEALDGLRKSLILNEALPNIIFLDLKMPRQDGKVLLRHIKASPGLRCVPVVVMSTSDAEVDIAESYAFGANSYIVKPSTFDQMILTLQKIKRYWFETVQLCDKQHLY